MNNYIQRIVKYLTEDIWRVRKFELSGTRIFTLNIVRIVYLSIKGFIYDKCQQKASALTFYSLLSVVPMLVLILGIASGFGLDTVVEKELMNHMSNQREVLDYFIKMAKNYVSESNDGLIVVVGLGLLFWSIMKVLGNIEQSFNDIWEVTRSRSFARKFTDYLAILIVALLFFISTSSMVVFVAGKFNELNIFNDRIAELVNMGLPYVLISIVFTLVLYIMPNTKVRLTSAIIGGVVSGILFQILQYYYIHFQVGVSRYNSIYGGFAALPLFLIWLQSSWLVVLFGAEVAFSVQNVNSYEFDADTKNLSVRYKKIVALIITHNIVCCFDKGNKASNSLSMSVDLKIPIRLVNEVIHSLIKAEVVVEVHSYDGEDETGFIPAVDINKLTVYDVIKKMENAGVSDVYFEKTVELKKFEAVVGELTNAMTNHNSNILIKDM